MEESKSENKIEYKQLADIGSGLIIAQVSIDKVREQDINARLMKNEMMKQLAGNIKKRGQLESLPFCALTNDGTKIEIISGHHRIRAARDAGMKEIPVILDITGLSRSKIAAKQLAHNAINGFDDQSTLKEIAKIIDDVDDMLESYIGKDILEEPVAELEKLLSPTVSFDWKNVTFTFLPHQIADMDKLISSLEATKPEILGVADIEQHEEFMKVLAKYQNFANVKNVGAAIHAMVRGTAQFFEEIGFEEDQEWVQISSVIGSAAIPAESAEVIKEALKKAMDDKVVTKNNVWQMVEYWAADYLAGK